MTMLHASSPKTIYSLDNLYEMVSSIYSEQNAQRSPSATFSHFVEVCGMLSILDRKKVREGLTVEGALCKSLGWFFPLMAKFRVVSVEELIFRKYPFVCPYCRYAPHKDENCKTTKGELTVNKGAVEAKYVQNASRRPQTLNQWQAMFAEIYPRSVNDLGSGRSTLGLLEEVGELAEAVRVFERHPKFFAGEAADVFSYIMGVANEHQLAVSLNGGPFDFEGEFLRRYPGLCLQCGYEVCICPSVPESTVGRLSKELELSPLDKLFALDIVSSNERGRMIGTSVLAELGGLPMIAQNLPLDRGDANRAVVVLCLKLANEVEKKDGDLANDLRQAASRIASDARNPGSKGHAESPAEVVSLLSAVWPLLNLAVISPEEPALHARLGKLLQAQSCKIGIIAALPKEFAAMTAMLDEPEEKHVAGDPNSYLIGKIPTLQGENAHLVVLTLLKDMGNNSASAATANMLRSFPGVEDVLMVGIAGGIPAPESAEHHVRLGDVVVSHKQGIIQYDNRKLETGKITIRSSSDRPSARMIDAIQRLEAGRVAQRFPWEEFIPRAASLEASERPSDSDDLLYDWSGLEKKLVPHPADPIRRNGQPKIHYGLIGAANVLLREPDLRDRLRREHDVKAIEMEGSGIADATWAAGHHYLVIRGISDYCDASKSDQWQQYAAIAAAAYARAVVAAVKLNGHQSQ